MVVWSLACKVFLAFNTNVRETWEKWIKFLTKVETFLSEETKNKFGLSICPDFCLEHNNTVMNWILFKTSFWMVECCPIIEWCSFQILVSKPIVTHTTYVLTYLDFRNLFAWNTNSVAIRISYVLINWSTALPNPIVN